MRRGGKPSWRNDSLISRTKSLEIEEQRQQRAKWVNVFTLRIPWIASVAFTFEHLVFAGNGENVVRNFVPLILDCQVERRITVIVFD